MDKNRKISVYSENNFIPKSNKDDVIHLMLLLKDICPCYAFIVPTPTGLRKSIMDATCMVRYFLKQTNIHDYNEQQLGPENKKIIESYLVNPHSKIKTKIALYRPKTKKGDPRVWIYGLKKYAKQGDYLMLFEVDKIIYVVNLSNEELVNSIENKTYVYNIILQSKKKEDDAKTELINRLKSLGQKWIRATAPGDNAVGDTLEHELGIQRNSSPNPDYRGIELKATRITRNSKKRSQTRITLFTKTPTGGLTYKKILEKYGKMQVPDGHEEARLQIYDTLKATRANSYNLFLKTDIQKELLWIMHSDSGNLNDSSNESVSSWALKVLINRLEKKHKKTCFVKAKAEIIGGVECFKYVQAIYTSGPNVSVLFDLFNNDKITIDLAIHKESETKARDHGVLFKMMPSDLNLLFGDEEIIDLI